MIQPRCLASRKRRSTSNAGSTTAHFRSEEHTSELQSQSNLVCRLLLEKKNVLHKSGCNARGSHGTIQLLQFLLAVGLISRRDSEVPYLTSTPRIDRPRRDPTHVPSFSY